MTFKELKDFIKEIESITSDDAEVGIWQSNGRQFKDLSPMNGVKHIVLALDEDGLNQAVILCPYGYHLPDGLQYLASGDIE